MEKREFQEMIRRGTVLLDGATGSNMLAAGMRRGECPEQWMLRHPQALLGLQRAYAAAGSQILYAPTFTANRYYLASYGIEERHDQINRELAALTRQAAGETALVAGVMTTIGRPLYPQSEITDSMLFDIYTAQARALVQAGVDLLVAETMLGCTETVIALEAAQGVCSLPVLCTFTVEADGRTYFGDDAVEAGQTLAAMGADAVGVNCSGGAVQILPVVRNLVRAVSLPVVAKPNAGMPEILPDGTARYDMTPERFAAEMAPLLDAGASLVGGCCGTTPAEIRALAALVSRSAAAGAEPKENPADVSWPQ